MVRLTTKKQNKMKKYTLLVSLLLIACSWGCQEEERGQIPLDNIPPGQVTSVSVKNVPGGAIISYTIPDDKDLLYVKAVYKLDNGTVMEQKASAYSNKLEIVGIGKSAKQMVQIITGDRSKNESKPLEVEIHPQDSPIYDVLRSLKVQNDFGGIRVTWENPLEMEIIIDIDTLDQENQYTTAGTFYTKTAIGKNWLRGCSPIEQLYAVSIRDRWGNTTDTVSGLYEPYREEQIDPKQFRKWNPPGIPYGHYGGYIIEYLWDGNYAFPSTFLTPLTGRMGDSFTLDMGQLAKLSRVRIIQYTENGEWAFDYGNIRSFEFYASPHPNVDEKEDTWIFMGTYESNKPSGLPVGQNTAEDLELARNGEDFMVDISLPPVRYVRFKFLRTWGGIHYLSVNELEFFGIPVE
jgi:hypothetical protein